MCGRPAASRPDEERDVDIWLTERDELEAKPLSRACGRRFERAGVTDMRQSYVPYPCRTSSIY